MVELKTMIPDIEYDLKYATQDNFTGKKLYQDGNFTFLRLLPALALQKAAQDLRASGYRLKIFDAYRPHSVTVTMWNLIQDERYVASPSKGSGHNRGLSIDLTLIDSSGNELDMGTPFDHFSDTAHHSFSQLPATVIHNRKLLRETLERYGFKALETEWWHYSWPNDREYDVLDIPPSKLRETCH